ncbi:MAG: cytidine deaminase [Puniceicoccaceae bacterium]|nr:MAG: cytidine deaminase [Puniceicoccaceae bacterium]
MLLSNKSIERAIDQLERADNAANGVRAALDNPRFKGLLEATDVDDPENLLPLAAAFSVHPISGFAVGAIAVGVSGRLYLGANMEFQSMPLNASLHAEQSALLNAWMHEENEVVALHVSELPCGHCRQFLRELSNFTTLDLSVRGQLFSPGQLLPNAFGELPPSGHGLLDSRSSALEAVHPQPDTFQQRAINAAQRSYVPYSRSPEGFVIECLDGRFFTGRAAESAAFNPSVSSALVALNQRNLSSSRQVTITRAIQAKLATSINSPLAFARALIHSVSTAEIEVVQMDAGAAD